MKNIVVVDDDLDLLVTIKMVLDEFGKDYKVKTFDCGLKLLDYLKKNSQNKYVRQFFNREYTFWAVLKTVIPEMDGWKLVQKIKRSPTYCDIPIIFLTSVTDDTSIITAQEIADGFIEKPFTTDELINTIEKLIRK